MLRLRLDAGGALTGTLDTAGPISQRVNLRDVGVSGPTLDYTMSDGNRFQGKFSNDGKTLTSTLASTVDATWQHVRTAAQAVAYEAAENSKPTNGDWSGVVDYPTNFPGVPPSKATAKMTLHFKSNPASCLESLQKATDRVDIASCQMTLTGNTLHVDRVAGYHATFNGTLSADGNHLRGTWTMGNDWHWKDPVQIDLTHTPHAK